ncbi:hypothetical protein [Micromonospora sp. IBHARD004]|uniref:hypothetical protein n=1 Tax=Micromonospora sp. IBHARD004 TaxID=3457764 RepID=UPI00405991E1
MKPPASSPGVSAWMKKQKSFDTAQELQLRRLLYSRGLRYRIHSEVVPGTRRRVDLAFVTAKGRCLHRWLLLAWLPTAWIDAYGQLGLVGEKAAGKQVERCGHRPPAL